MLVRKVIHISSNKCPLANEHPFAFVAVNMAKIPPNLALHHQNAIFMSFWAQILFPKCHSKELGNGNAHGAVIRIILQ